MDIAPKAAFPVRPRFQPIDYITGNVPSIDSEEYQQILKEEEEARKKVVEETKRKRNNTSTDTINDVVAKLNLQFPNERPKRERKSCNQRYLYEEENTYHKPVQKRKINKEKVVEELESSLRSSISSESLNKLEECDIDYDISSTDESFDSDEEDETEKHALYQIDERLLEYVLNAREESEQLIQQKEKVEEDLEKNPDDSSLTILEHDHSFGLKTLKNGDIVWIDKKETNGGFKKAMILLAYHEYNSKHEYFEGQQIVLSQKAKQRIMLNPDEYTSVFLVHYLNSDRRLDEWIDESEIHCLIERAVETTVDDNITKTDNSKTRSDRKLGDEFTPGAASKDVGATYAKCEEKLEKVTMVRNIDTIEIGPHSIGCWYFSPFPPKIVVTRNLYMCEYCLWYCAYADFYALHKKTCQKTEPPGPVIYYGDKFVVHEVNGNDNYRYCQSLCLLSKLFLDHKTIFYAIKTFYFYVLVEIDDNGKKHIAGFFSKENFSMNNLACIMVLPPYQRKGYGKFLIQLSYTLSARENFIGSPEKPLSDLGKISYRSLWWYVLINTLEALQVEEDFPVAELSACTGIHEEDIISTFQSQQLIKKWRDGIYVVFNEQILAYCKSLSMFRAPKLLLDVNRIVWTKRYQTINSTDNIYSEELQKQDILKRKANMERTQNSEGKKAKKELLKYHEEKGFGHGHIGCLDSSEDEKDDDEYIDYNSMVVEMIPIENL